MDDDLKRYQKALSACEKNIDEDPYDETLYRNQGVILMKLGCYSQAIQSFDQALKLKPNFARAFYFKGISLRQLGKYQQSIQAFDAALRIKPNIPDIHNQKACSLIHWAESMESGDPTPIFQKALRCAELASELSTGKEGHFHMACALARLDKPEKALAALWNSAELLKKRHRTRAWEHPALQPLRSQPYLEAFIKLAGPPPIKPQTQLTQSRIC